MSNTMLYEKNKTANEPKVHPLIRKSFVFVSSAGMRLAPEILILELMREVFFEKHYGNTTTGTKDLDPDECDSQANFLLSNGERAALHSLRGRRKKSKNSATQSFFAPPYPQLAHRGWLGKNRERVINNFLFSGPIAQYLWHKGESAEEGKEKQQELVEKIIKAFIGHSSCLNSNIQGKEILAVVLGPDSFGIDKELPEYNLREKTKSSDSVIKISNDTLARRITQDFISLCDLEAELPRLQWIQLVMTFLRFALPMWLLSQMQITCLLHSWLIAAVDGEKISSTESIVEGLTNRNQGLLHPTLTPTKELFEHIDRYMKHRVELNILLYCIEEVKKEEIEGKKLILQGAGKDVLGIDKLLMLAKDVHDDIREMERFKQVANGLDFRTFLTREGEKFAAWRNPLMRGQGKNIDEFFRVLYRAEVGDEAGGYLLIPEGRGAKRGFRVFPGQMLLKTVTYLTAQNKWAKQRRGSAGKLVLQDVEEHFEEYGIDFSTAADARPLLMNELQAMGLLTGSPDAGSSVAVACPY